MVRFSDLAKKEANRKGEPQVSPIEDVVNETVPSLNVNQWYQNACRFLERTLEQVGAEEKLDESFFMVVDEGEQLIEEIVQAHSLGYLPEELLIQALHLETASSFLVTNPVNVTVYAIVMGASLGLPRERLRELGLAALLHDLGKIRVPEEILYKDKGLSDREWAVLKSYPHESFKLLSFLGANYSHLAETAIQVCEALDGSGYPQGLQGEEIHPYAQIIGLLDIFEAVSHHRPYRQKFPHFEAVKKIIRTKKHAFHKDLLKALIRTFSLFPIHSHVKLNSGAIGRVIQTYGDQVLRPRVEIVLDAQKKRVLIPRAVDLKDQALLHVVDAVAEEDLLGYGSNVPGALGAETPPL
jgi:HD-GYP domain-containing protein (c-di-GMP phosphodiesterase class II)